MNQSTFDLGGYATDRGFTMAVGERPQQRLENFGVAAASDTELLAMILQGNGTRTEQVVNLASRLIAEAGSIAGLISWVPSDYRRLKGIGQIKGLQLAALAEIARRMMTSQKSSAPLLNRADLIADYFAPIVAGLQIEKFWVVCLNRKNYLIKRIELTSGTATNTLVHPREVFRAAIREGATAIVCAHNHPSGDPTPSAADMQVTRQLREAAKIVDIHLLDHLVIGTASADPASVGYYSFRQAGLI
ncbi:MAG TPA: DNA repair protein RadC [Opitutaceae bacterium]|jgi:DNA repair protein RadC|nr:DNA repair protein RadC [Opitutaceae bacterium]